MMGPSRSSNNGANGTSNRVFIIPDSVSTRPLRGEVEEELGGDPSSGDPHDELQLFSNLHPTEICKISTERQEMG